MRDVPIKRHNVRLSLVYKKVVDLHENPRNPRKHSARQRRQIKASLERFGFILPILIDGKSMVVAGNACLRAAVEVGYDEVPTILLDHLPSEEIKALIIAHNRLAEKVEWDYEILAEAFKSISVGIPELDPDALGFTLPEIDEVLVKAVGQLELPSAEPQPKVDQPEISDPYPGDIWQKGERRIVCLHDRDRVLVAALTANDNAFATLFPGSTSCIAPVSKARRKFQETADMPVQVACGWPKNPSIAGGQNE